MNAIPTPPPPPIAAPGLLTSLDTVLRLVLGRLDPDRATTAQVRDALHAAGVTVTAAWAGDWLQRARATRSIDPITQGETSWKND